MAFFLFPLSLAWSFQIDLTSAQIQEAIDCGKINNGNEYTDVMKEWRVESNNNKVGFIIVDSSFYYLASFSYLQSKKYQELLPKEIKELISRSKNEVFFNIYVYGNSIDFAEDYHVVLKYKDKIIQPKTKKNESYASTSGYWPNDPAYSAMLNYGFLFRKQDSKSKKETMIFNPDDTITLTIIPPNDNEINIEVDLSAMR